MFSFSDVFYMYSIQYSFVLKDNLSKPRSLIGPALNLVVLKRCTSKHNTSFIFDSTIM